MISSFCLLSCCSTPPWAHSAFAHKFPFHSDRALQNLCFVIYLGLQLPWGFGDTAVGIRGLVQLEDEWGASTRSTSPQDGAENEPWGPVETHGQAEPLVYGLAPLPPDSSRAVSSPCSGGFAAAARFVARSQPSKSRQACRNLADPQHCRAQHRACRQIAVAVADRARVSAPRWN